MCKAIFVFFICMLSGIFSAYGAQSTVYIYYDSKSEMYANIFSEKLKDGLAKYGIITCHLNVCLNGSDGNKGIAIEFRESDGFVNIEMHIDIEHQYIDMLNLPKQSLPIYFSKKSEVNKDIESSVLSSILILLGECGDCSAQFIRNGDAYFQLSNCFALSDWNLRLLLHEVEALRHCKMELVVASIQSIVISNNCVSSDCLRRLFWLSFYLSKHDRKFTKTLLLKTGHLVHVLTDPVDKILMEKVMIELGLAEKKYQFICEQLKTLSEKGKIEKIMIGQLSTRYRCNV